MKSIQTSLSNHYKDTKAANVFSLCQENSILGVFAYGSMNYGTWREGISDVDSKMIVIPHLDQLIFNRPVVYEHKMENNEKCVVMDIRHFANNVKKQNINFTEIMFTPHKFLLDRFPFDCARKEIWNYYMREPYAEQLARYDEVACVKSICGQALHTLHQDATNGKKVANAYRLDYFLEHYLKGEDSYVQCIQPSGLALTDILEFKYSEAPVSKKISENLTKKFQDYLSIADTQKLREHKSWGDEYLNKMVKDLITVDLQLKN